MGTGRHFRLDFRQRSQALVVVIRTDIENVVTSFGEGAKRIYARIALKISV